jgi:hypothetical protein
MSNVSSLRSSFVVPLTKTTFYPLFVALELCLALAFAVKIKSYSSLNNLIHPIKVKHCEHLRLLWNL